MVSIKTILPCGRILLIVALAPKSDNDIGTIMNLVNSVFAGIFQPLIPHSARSVSTLIRETPDANNTLRGKLKPMWLLN